MDDYDNVEVCGCDVKRGTTFTFYDVHFVVLCVGAMLTKKKVAHGAAYVRELVDGSPSLCINLSWLLHDHIEFKRRFVSNPDGLVGDRKHAIGRKQWHVAARAPSSPSTTRPSSPSPDEGSEPGSSAPATTVYALEPASKRGRAGRGTGSALGAHDTFALPKDWSMQPLSSSMWVGTRLHRPAKSSRWH